VPNPPFPTFNNGVVSGIDGYGEADLLYSTVEALDSGYGNAYAWNSYIDDSGVFHNFQEERFSIAFPMFTQAEVGTLEAFFASMAGPYGYFTFTDDQGITWPQCQFDQETLEVQYLGPNQYSVEAKILAVTQAPIPPRPLPNPPPPPPPPPAAINSAVLNVVSSYVQAGNALFQPAAFVGLPSLFHFTSFDGLHFWGTRTDTAVTVGTVPSTVAGFTGMAVTFQLEETLGGSAAGPGLVRWFIDDVNIVLTLADTSTQTIRPTTTGFTLGTDGGDVLNASNLIDADPSNGAIFESRSGGPLSTNSVFTVTF
jgi:hypothetical protein